MEPDPDIGICIASPHWRRAVPRVAAVCRRAALAALAGGAPPPGSRPVPAGAELAIVLADNAAVRRLNRAYRGRDKPTNVLSFPAADGVAPAGAPAVLGDVILAAETVLAEAAAQGKTPTAHLSHLVVHGVLHLLGFDHETGAEAARMEALEIAVLAGLGFADPYQEGAMPAQGAR